MDIQVLKEQIEQNKVSDSLLIFVNNENSFLSNQYIKAIQEDGYQYIEFDMIPKFNIKKSLCYQLYCF